MRLGVAWYPEQHPPDRWAEDARRMVDAGLELVRLGDFAWASLEPERGHFTWDWLDRSIDIAASAGLQVVLATPTAAPPIWLALERPKILSVGPDGRRRAYGTRRFTCPTEEAYREESRRIVGELVGRYGDHNAIIAWQLDNEPGNHDSAWCWCRSCERAFGAWLRQRYGTIADLNRAWGSVFWGAIYPSFEAVSLPRPSSAAHSPSLLLAHRRFASDQVVSAIAEQHALVAAGTSGRGIVSNLAATETRIDPRAIARVTGAAAINVYPSGHGSDDDVAFLLDLAVGHTGRAWVMEHQPGPVNWTPRRDPVDPGRVRLWGWRAALHGVDALLFFSWRPTRSGSEQSHAGLIRHDGRADGALTEVTELASELGAMGRSGLERPRSPIAVLWSIDDHWAIELEPNRPGLTLRDLCVAAYSAAHRLGLEVDVVAPESDLRSYAAVLAPGLRLVTAARLDRLREALDAGTLVVIGPRSLTRDIDDCTIEEPAPAGLSDRLGAWVVEGVSVDDSVSVHPFDAPAGPWADVLEMAPSDQPSDAPASERAAAEPIAWYGGSSHLAGQPAAVRRGLLTYAGFSSADAWTALLRVLLADRLPLADVPASRERFLRDGHIIELGHADASIDGLPVDHRPSAVRMDRTHD